MDFWAQHAKTEAHLAELERAMLPPSAQNAPAPCIACDHVGPDVMFGLCPRCEDA